MEKSIEIVLELIQERGMEVLQLKQYRHTTEISFDSVLIRHNIKINTWQWDCAIFGMWYTGKSSHLSLNEVLEWIKEHKPNDK